MFSPLAHMEDIEARVEVRERNVMRTEAAKTLQNVKMIFQSLQEAGSLFTRPRDVSNTLLG